MRSHSYDFARRDLLPLIGGPILPMIAFAAAMHLSAVLRILPHPRPALDTDRTILIHQAEASRRVQDANLLFIGDSSCLMDAATPEVQALLPKGWRALNLGTLSYLDLNSYASILKHFFAANPDRAKEIVLLMHPEALRRLAPTEYHVEVLEHYYSGTDFCDPSMSRIPCWLGSEVFRGRLWSRLVPVPLGGAYGRNYGFTSDLGRYLSNNGGSAFDPGTFDLKSATGNAEYRLSKSLESASKAFRAQIPAGVKLLVGITPTPETFVGPAFVQRYQEMETEWAGWLQADKLDGLPPTLPSPLFASTSHLNAEGRRVYAEILARALRPHLQP